MYFVCNLIIYIPFWEGQLIKMITLIKQSMLNKTCQQRKISIGKTKPSHTETINKKKIYIQSSNCIIKKLAIIIYFIDVNIIIQKILTFIKLKESFKINEHISVYYQRKTRYFQRLEKKYQYQSFLQIQKEQKEKTIIHHQIKLSKTTLVNKFSITSPTSQNDFAQNKTSMRTNKINHSKNKSKIQKVPYLAIQGPPSPYKISHFIKGTKVAKNFFPGWPLFIGGLNW
eukprot:TRINITY_DN27812_c0_g1_i5.p1 TRINITY_DN27812_c0_g1~~TRINITY_DN27812_c0_g1_i5.p1  ORF type:complete len:228 (-),score=-9.56 TRINITY_DN27812_c0_g1_i5:76-759(-)